MALLRARGISVSHAGGETGCGLTLISISWRGDRIGGGIGLFAEESVNRLLVSSGYVGEADLNSNGESESTEERWESCKSPIAASRGLLLDADDGVWKRSSEEGSDGIAVHLFIVV